MLPGVRRLRPLAIVAPLAAWLCVSPPTAAGLTLVGETAAGAFVTMTAGARCPSTMTVTFLSQGEASGTLEGRHDEQGSLRLALNEAAGTSTSGVRLDVCDQQDGSQRSHDLGARRRHAPGPVVRSAVPPHRGGGALPSRRTIRGEWHGAGPDQGYPRADRRALFRTLRDNVFGSGTDRTVGSGGGLRGSACTRHQEFC